MYYFRSALDADPEPDLALSLNKDPDPGFAITLGV